MKLTLPTNSDERKDIPLYSGCYNYFPAALAGVAMHSKAGNDKHNPGEPLHHARGKSIDHADCITRHLMDLADMQARRVVWTEGEQAALLAEANALCWRALALSQELHEKFGAPLAPAARPALKPLMFKDNPFAGQSTAQSAVNYYLEVEARKYPSTIEQDIRRNTMEVDHLDALIRSAGQAHSATRSDSSGSGSTLPQCGQTPAPSRACEPPQRHQAAETELAVPYRPV